MKQRRLDLGLTQVEVGVRSNVKLRTIDRIEEGDEEIRAVEFMMVAGVLGMQLVMSHEESGYEQTLGGPESVKYLHITPGDTQGRIAESLDHLRKEAKKQRREHHIVLDYRYREQVEAEVWGRRLTPSDSWKDLPTWDGVAVSFKSHIGDEMVLVRNNPSVRWPSRLAAHTIAPESLNGKQAEAYRVLRADGHSEEGAYQIAAVV